MASDASSLDRYNQMRDFAETPEPEGRAGAAEGNSFVIQKHDATRLHYDFRIELDGVMKSWAVTKGPSLDPSEKRLAVRTEDHPVDYNRFEGVIPKGYGAGTVMIWDRGSWEPDGDPHEGLKKGHLKFTLHGERLTGGFALIRMKSKGEKRENWLLVKQKDETADPQTDPIDAWTTSIVTDRDLDAIAKADPPAPSSDTETEMARPDFTDPQLATLRDEPPAGRDWVHEVKYDGYRIQALLHRGTVRLVTRNGKDWTQRYPVIATALQRVPVTSAAIDGELVALDDDGRSKFEALQGAGKHRGAKLAYYAFDLLEIDGEDLKPETLLARKRVLEQRLKKAPACIRYSDHIRGRGGKVIEKACALHLEGVISKKADAPYRSGRGTSWIKSKCVGNDEFVIGGWRRSDKQGRPFASLLLGEYVEGELVWRGRVGTGWDDRTMEAIASKLKPLERKTPPFAEISRSEARDAVWVTPRLVAQIAYTERTGSGALRHPSFLGLREDKDAKTVTAPKAPSSDTDTKRDASGDGKAAGQARKDSAATGKSTGSDAATVAGIKLTHPDRVLYPDQGITKRQLAEYLDTHADRILDHLAGRPVSLVRCPDGREGQCFFQKRHAAGLPEAIGHAEITLKDGETADYLTIDSREGLVAAAQFGVLEFHIWGARTDRLERPDRLVFDLDPDEGLAFSDVRDAAREVRGVLDALGLESFPLLTGGKGIHVVVPLERRRDWPEVKAFAKGLATRLATTDPDRYVATASKAKRKGRIFIDWLRNERGSTAIVPFSPRARAGAPVAVPVDWDELSRMEGGNAYTLHTLQQRFATLTRTPWDGYASVRQSITNAMLDAVNQED